MTAMYTITPELRVKFKEPFGLLVKGSFDQTMDKMREIRAQNPPKLITVGDVVTKNLQTYKIPFDLSITDNQCMRKKTQAVAYTSEVIKVKNPQGTITRDAMEAIKKALKSKEVNHIVVDGEEDLLVIAVIAYAPENSVVVYGQPYEGIVLVKVSPEKKTEVLELLKAMEKCSKS